MFIKRGVFPIKKDQFLIYETGLFENCSGHFLTCEEWSKGVIIYPSDYFCSPHNFANCSKLINNNFL
jgi:hypothetical protein